MEEILTKAKGFSSDVRLHIFGVGGTFFPDVCPKNHKLKNMGKGNGNWHCSGENVPYACKLGCSGAGHTDVEYW